MGTAATAFVMLTLGCNVLDRFEEGGATVFVFTTHHATLENGVFPGRGEDDMPRVYDNAEGWTVTMLEGYVTISAATLVSCGGSEHELNMFWGPCPEDLKFEDLASLTVAGNKVGEGDYCTLRVTYDAYQMPVIDESVEPDDTRHQTPANPAVYGSTIYLRGGAQLGDGEFTQFELTTAERITVDLDLSNLEGEGQPLHVDHREDFPVELLVSKAYDRFFDGVDFDAFDPTATEVLLPQVLEDQTHVSLGSYVMTDAPPAPMDGSSGGGGSGSSGG